MNFQQLAAASDFFILLAMVVYMMAFVAFAVDLAKAVRVRSDVRLAKKTRERELATVGAPASSDFAGSAPAADLDLSEGADDAEAELAPARGMNPLTFALGAATIATAFQLLGVVARGIATQRVPWGNMYEFSMTGAAVIMAMFLLLALRVRDMRRLGLFVLTPVLFIMVIAYTSWYLPAAHLTPSLQNSPWLVIHVIVAILSMALFSLSAVVALLQLLQHSRESRLEAGNEAGSSLLERVLERVPNAKRLEQVAFQTTAVGFVLWTFTLIFGAIWANYAWGRYWNWDPKETWTFVIWIVYAVYLHARATIGFRGKIAAYFCIAGFVCVIFNYTIVNTVINGLHSYSGL